MCVMLKLTPNLGWKGTRFFNFEVVIHTDININTSYLLWFVFDWPRMNLYFSWIVPEGDDLSVVDREITGLSLTRVLLERFWQFFSFLLSLDFFFFFL